MSEMHTEIHTGQKAVYIYLARPVERYTHTPPYKGGVCVYLSPGGMAGDAHGPLLPPVCISRSAGQGCKHFERTDDHGN